MKYLKAGAMTLVTILGVVAPVQIVNATNTGINIDKVLGELSRQHNNASSLVKSTRDNTSLALSSSLVKQTVGDTKKDSEMLLGQLSIVASNTISKFKQSDMASWYGRQFHGKPTASGETFDMNAMTAAHSSLPMNCYIKVTNKDNGKSVVVKVNDRPSQANRILDLSYGAAKAIGLTQKGMGNVSIERID